MFFTWQRTWQVLGLNGWSLGNAPVPSPVITFTPDGRDFTFTPEARTFVFTPAARDFVFTPDAR